MNQLVALVMLFTNFGENISNRRSKEISRPEILMNIDQIDENFREFSKKTKLLKISTKIWLTRNHNASTLLSENDKNA